MYIKYLGGVILRENNIPGGMKRLRIPSTSSTVEVEGSFSEYCTDRYCNKDPDAKRN